MPKNRRTDVIGRVRDDDVIFGANQGGGIRLENVLEDEVDIGGVIEAFFEERSQALVNLDREDLIGCAG